MRFWKAWEPTPHSCFLVCLFQLWVGPLGLQEIKTLMSYGWDCPQQLNECAAYVKHFNWFFILQMLDLSYNNLSQEDLLTLGLLSHLKVLHLTGNHFRLLPQDMAMPYLSREKWVMIMQMVQMSVKYKLSIK